MFGIPPSQEDIVTTLMIIGALIGDGDRNNCRIYLSANEVQLWML